jgi:hypothetical protein
MNFASSLKSMPRMDKEDPVATISCLMSLQDKLEDPDIIAQEVEKERQRWLEAERRNNRADIFQVRGGIPASVFFM